VRSASDHLSRPGLALWTALRQAIQHAVKEKGYALSLAGTCWRSELFAQPATKDIAASKGWIHGRLRTLASQQSTGEVATGASNVFIHPVTTLFI
jgi:hypothetical protein